MSPRPNRQDQSAATADVFDVLFDIEPLLLHSIDAEGVLLNVSSAWARLLGYSREELIGRRSVDIMAPASRAYALSRGLPLLYSRGHVSNIGYEFLRADGRPIPVLLTAGAIRDASGRYVKSLTAITDDRRARYAERELDARDRRDADGGAPMRALLERLGHETRTPLGAILGFATLMEQGSLDDTQRDRLKQVLSAAETLRSALDAALAGADSHLAARRGPSAPMERQRDGTAPPPLKLAPMRVLVAMSDTARQDALREILHAGGHKVVTCANGYEAIEALFANPVDLAFIDLDMPGLSGPATVAQIRNSGRVFHDIPIIACAGEGTSPGLNDLRRMGMDGQIAPGCTRGTLDQEMRRVLEARSPGSTP